MSIISRVQSYAETQCWQYSIRCNNRAEDLILAGIASETSNSLRVADFSLQFEEKSAVYSEVKAFISRHEWLGKMSLYPTHLFTARYNGILAGVVVMDMPAVFSKLLGEDTKKIERLISRGACVSWSPKNLASSLIMFSISWMVKNTPYRLFTAYSDPEAKELGTIYQACNFAYLGKKYGTGYQYRISEDKWVSDRYFRSRSAYKRYAKQAGIEWDSAWQDKEKIHFDQMPESVVCELRRISKEQQASCEKRKVGAKHKYAYILGKTKAETKKLRLEFVTRHGIKAYPKVRGE